MTIASAAANGTPRMRARCRRMTAAHRRLREHAADVGADGLAMWSSATRMRAACARRPQREDAVDPGPAAAEQERGEHEDREQREQRVHDAEPDVAEHVGRVADPPREPLGLLLQLLGDVVVLLQSAQRRVPVGELAHVLRVRGRSWMRLFPCVDERRDDQHADPDGISSRPRYTIAIAKPRRMWLVEELTGPDSATARNTRSGPSRSACAAGRSGRARSRTGPR